MNEDIKILSEILDRERLNPHHPWTQAEIYLLVAIIQILKLRIEQKQRS